MGGLVLLVCMCLLCVCTCADAASISGHGRTHGRKLLFGPARECACWGGYEAATYHIHDDDCRSVCCSVPYDHFRFDGGATENC